MFNFIYEILNCLSMCTEQDENHGLQYGHMDTGTWSQQREHPTPDSYSLIKIYWNVFHKYSKAKDYVGLGWIKW